MTVDRKKSLFEHYRKSLTEAGLKTSESNALICPLCWKEAAFTALSLEHIVPSSIGGTRTVLTCRDCNNRHGSSLDAHLARYQTVADAFQGHGTLPTKLRVNGREVVANLHWGKGTKNFMIVGKASNPAMLDGLKQDLAGGTVPSIDVTFILGYAKQAFQTAVLRAAYLIAFERFGYEYARHEVVQTIRRRIIDSAAEHPRLGSLVFEMREFRPPLDDQHHVMRGNVNGVPFFLVVIRVRKATTSYLGAFLPAPSERCGEFFDLMEQYSKEHDGES